MTREEAIRHLEDILCENNTVKHSDMVIFEQEKEALRMAIKALSQQTEDAISRQAVDGAIYDYSRSCDVNHAQIMEYIDKIPSVNPQEPSNISNDGTLTVNVEDGRKISRVLVCGANHWGGLYYPDEKESKMEQFARWVASEIFYDDWEYNKDAFDELACRKLAKLGIVRAKGNEWELVEPQESEERA